MKLPLLYYRGPGGDFREFAGAWSSSLSLWVLLVRYAARDVYAARGCLIFVEIYAFKNSKFYLAAVKLSRLNIFLCGAVTGLLLQI